MTRTTKNFHFYNFTRKNSLVKDCEILGSLGRKQKNKIDDFFRSLLPHGNAGNSNGGGNLGIKRSEETKRKIGLYQKTRDRSNDKNQRSPEERERIRMLVLNRGKLKGGKNPDLIVHRDTYDIERIVDPFKKVKVPCECGLIHASTYELRTPEELIAERRRLICIEYCITISMMEIFDTPEGVSSKTWWNNFKAIFHIP